MRGLAAILTILILATSGRSQTPGQGTAQVQGTVFDAAQGRPVANAEIRIGEQRATSDVSGRFAVNGVSQGRQTLIANRVGYIASTLIVAVGPNAQLALDLRLMPAAYATGTVVDSYGQPVIGAMVRVYRSLYGADGLRTVVGAGPFVETDDRGVFHADLAPGEYIFRIEKSRPDTDIRDPFIPTLYPQQQSGSPTQTVTIVAGATTSLPRILLPSAPGSRVQVTLVDEAGDSPSVGYVAFRRKDDPSLMSQTNTTSASGFSTRLLQGTYEVEAGVVTAGDSRTSIRDRANVFRTSLEVRDKDIDLPIKLTPGTRVDGRLMKRAKDGAVAPAPGVQVQLNGQNFLYLSMLMTTVTAADGTFSFPSLPAGTYRFVPATPPGFCVSEMRQNETPLSDDKVTITGASLALTAVFRESTTRIQGTVLDAKGQQGRGAVVALVPDDRKQYRNFFETAADQNGAFEFGCAPPGTYRVFAWGSLPGAAYRNEEFMAAYKGRGTELRVVEGDNATIRTELIER